MAKLKVSGKWTKEPISRDIFGNFIESGFGRQVNGMWSEMLYNRAFRKVPEYKYATWEWPVSYTHRGQYPPKAGKKPGGAAVHSDGDRRRLPHDGR